MGRHSPAKLIGAGAFSAAALLLLAIEPSASAEIQVYTSGAPAEVQKALAASFTQATGDQVVVTAGTLKDIRERLGAGAKADVIVLPNPVMDALEKSGMLQPGSRIELARVGIGVVVREGAPRPDISTPDALRKTLLAAHSIAYPDPAGGGFTGAQISRMLEQMGIADAVKPKLKLGYAFTGGVAQIAKGEAELGLFNISEILPVKGVTLVGALPPELQNYITFSGAVHAGSASSASGRTYLQSLADTSAGAAWARGGFESLGPAMISALAAAELKVLSPGATEGAFTTFIPQFQSASGYKIAVTYGPVGVLADRVSNGEAADVVILSQPAAKKLGKEGKLVAGSEAAIAKVGIGVFVRKGDPKPDISSADAFLRAVAHSKAIAYADPTLGGSTSILIAEVMQSIDVTGSIAAKTKLTRPAKPLLDLVAGGNVDFGLNPVSEILLDPRVELVGPLPPEIQRYTRYVAALVAGSRQDAGFKALIAFLTSPAAETVFKAKGFEPR